jgi:hypothetical protein
MTNALGLTFEEWVAQRCGPVAYPERDSRSWDDILGLCDQLKTRCVKTWLGIPEPGAAVSRIQTPYYKRMIDTFDTVHFNVCPHYNTLGYTAEEGLPASTLDLVENEWYELSRYLFNQYGSREMTILFGIFAELNCYMGTRVSKQENYPVTDYINASHRGLARARVEAGTIPLHIYDVAEVQCEVEYYDFVARAFPGATADLYSLSYYCFHRDIHRQLDWIRQHTQPSDTFGRQNLMLGEYGEVMENCCWNQSAQVRYLDSVLRAAWQEDCQYAFLYEIADHDVVMDVSGHCGLMRWTPQATPRLSWNYFSSINTVGTALVPQDDCYEDVPWLNASDPNAGDLTIEELTLDPIQPSDGDKVSVSATVRNIGKAVTEGTSVGFYADDHIFGYAGIGALEPGQCQTAMPTKQEIEFIWRAQPGQHKISAVVDARGKLAEANHRNNQLDKIVTVI